MDSDSPAVVTSSESSTDIVTSKTATAVVTSSELPTDIVTSETATETVNPTLTSVTPVYGVHGYPFGYVTKH